MLTIGAVTAPHLPHIIDLNNYSQSELLALSRTTASSAVDPNDVVVKIDRAVFNESAGSRRQTYSRPRTTTSPQSSSATGHHHRHRVAGLLPAPKTTVQPNEDREHIENKSIIGFLKVFVEENRGFDNGELYEGLPPPPEVVYTKRRDADGDEEETVRLGERKRKRGRKPKKTRLVEGVMMGNLNKNGVVVDLEALKGLDDPYGEELRRRTAGMESEEGLLGFLRDLSGQWVSRRKRRKIVDAGLFGDFLPVGWKLLLGLKRKEFRASVYCRRYVSPSGQHFESCKEVASYLQSYFGNSGAYQSDDHRMNTSEENFRIASECLHEVILREDGQNDTIESVTHLPVSIMSNGNRPASCLLGLENLQEVPVQDLIMCRSCNDMTFDDKESYLQHLVSVHQGSTRRYKVGSSVGDGVIIRDDGKFECQFCHKVFQERRRYNGHVGIHVRNYIRGTGESPSLLEIQKKTKVPSMDGLPSRISKMDALIEIAQNSILENSAIGHSSGSPNEIPVAIDDHIMSSDSFSEAEAEEYMMDIYVDHDMNQQKNEHAEMDESAGGTGNDVNLMAVKLNTCLDNATTWSAEEQKGDASETNDVALTADGNDKTSIGHEGSIQGNLIALAGNCASSTDGSYGKLVNASSSHNEKFNELNNTKNSELHLDSVNRNGGPALNAAEEANVALGENPNPMSLVRPMHSISSMDPTSSKGGEGISDVDQRRQNVTAFEELSLDEIDNLKFSTASGQEAFSVSEVPIDLANNTQIKNAHSSPAQFASENVISEMAGRHQVTTPCVWCGVEFNHDSDGTEVQSGSVGYMCPTCKAKISGQLDAMDGGSPMNPHHL